MNKKSHRELVYIDFRSLQTLEVRTSFSLCFTKKLFLAQERTRFKIRDSKQILGFLRFLLSWASYILIYLT